ncbi:MAG: hypothetical protein IT353_11325 [Gemmatimonadaceae bacterium]|nr:hypothetical protein [Gemmatimonadaceae bacterium]
MNRMHLSVVVGIATVIIAPQPGSAPRTLGAPTAVSDQEFTGIDGVRELRDGRVVVLDARERTIQVIDPKSKTARKIGRDGDGPGEFRLPLSFLSLGGDTTLVTDMARFGKLLVITPAGEMGGFVTTEDKALSPRNFVVAAVDKAGNFYENNYGGDSNSIVRWNRARGRRDTIAHISMKVVSPLIRPRPTAGSAPQGALQRSGGTPPPFFTLNQWAVSADGHVAIVTPEPYRVTIISPSGVRVQGVPIQTVPVSVGEAEKAAYRREREGPVPVITFSKGAQTTSYRKVGYTEPDEWPARLPPILPDAVSFASDGKLWVRRATRAGASTLYDVFDANAKFTYQVTLPARTKLVGFGAGTVFLARVDDDDLHYLQRYSLPK